ncbi:MAG: electron transport complex subunit RsxC [Solirubrobacterales bacterium]
MKLGPIRGGVHPDYRKELASEKAVVPLPIPRMLYVPLLQHVGAPAEPIVAIGDIVLKGQMIARSQGPVSAPVHAPTSGRVVDIGAYTAPHPSGLPQRTIVIEADGRDAWADLPAPIADPFAVARSVISERVAQAGIVGLGGASFPSAVKLDLGTRHPIDTLLINGAECEPYLTCDDRVMREYADEVVDGVRIMQYALGAKRSIIAIEGNKPQALATMRAAVATFSDLSVVAVPVRYPMGSADHLALAVTGREKPAGRRMAEIGVLVHNVATARAVSLAVRQGKPLISRVVTFTGGALAEPKNIDVPLGTHVADVVAFCGGFREHPVRIINGGPMMGQPLANLESPVVKGTCGIVALSEAEVKIRDPQPCIRCGSCVTACPNGLVPLEMMSLIKHDDLDKAAAVGVEDCISCGSCSYICPSFIPLVHYFEYAKGRIWAIARDKRKQDRVKKLVEARAARLEKIALAKREAMAARKAAAAAAPAPAAAPAAPTEALQPEASS